MKYLILFLYFSLSVGSRLYGIDFPRQDQEFPSQQLPQPTPFEKIYVTPQDVISTPEGTYYVTPDGDMEKVRAVLRDCCGTYIIKIAHICPVCGYACCEKNPPEGYDCPLWKIEVLPHIWD